MHHYQDLGANAAALIEACCPVDSRVLVDHGAANGSGKNGGKHGKSAKRILLNISKKKTFSEKKDDSEMNQHKGTLLQIEICLKEKLTSQDGLAISAADGNNTKMRKCQISRDMNLILMVLQ